MDHVCFCPEHGKILRIQRIPINKVKGWIDFQFFCPVKGCAYREFVIPKNAEVANEQINRSQSRELQSLPIIVSSSCPLMIYNILNWENAILNNACNVANRGKEIEQT